MYWYGDWYCSECQKEEEMYEHQAEADWYTASEKCQQCAYLDDPPYGYCIHYNMPIFMTKRKYKCKHFKEYVDHPDPVLEMDWSDYDEGYFDIDYILESIDKLFGGRFA